MTSQNQQLWKPEDVDFVFQNFLIFEKRFLDLVRIFPLAKENEGSWSPELVNLFLDISSLIDSISRHIVGLGKESSEKVEVKISSGSVVHKTVRDLDINDFETNFFSTVGIIDWKVFIFVYPVRIITPYNDYRASWWTIYNKLKHNRILNYTQANFIQTLNALAGLFLILVKYREVEFTKAWLRSGWLHSGLAPEFIHPARNRGEFFWIESELFGTNDGNVCQLSDDPNKMPFVSGRKLRNFLGRLNPV